MLFSPSRVRSFVYGVVSAKQPKFTIDFVGSELRLWDVWRPTIAIELANVTVKAKDPCVTNSLIQMDKIFIPLSIDSLFSENIVFGHVQAGNVRYFLRPANCENREKNETLALAVFERFFQTRWSKEVINTTRYLREFSMKTFELLRDNHSLAPLILEEFNMEFDASKAKSSVQFFVKVGEPWIGPTAVGRINVNSDIRSDEVSFSGRGFLKEGQFQLDLKWAVDSGDISVKLFNRDLPVQQVLQLTQHWGFLSSLRAEFTHQWLTCDITMDGRIRDFFTTPLKLHQCRFYGDLGHITVSTSELKNLNQVEGIVLEVQKLSFPKLLSALFQGRVWNQIGPAGTLTGQLSFTGMDTYELNSVIHDIELNAYPLNVNARQLIEKLNLHLTGDTFGVTAKLSQFTVKDGHAEGFVGIKSNQTGEVTAEFDFSRILPSVDFQRLAFDSAFKPIAARGEIVIKKSQIENVGAKLHFEEVHNLNWILKNALVQFDYDRSILKLQMKAQNLSLPPESRLKTLISELHTSVVSAPVDPALSKINGVAEYDFSQSHWLWISDFSSSTNGAKFTAQGDYRQGVLNGLVNRTTSQSKVWQIVGSISRPEIKAVDDR